MPIWQMSKLYCYESVNMKKLLIPKIYMYNDKQFLPPLKPLSQGNL